MKILNCASILSLQAPDLLAKFKNEQILTLSPLSDEKLNGEFIKCEIGAQSYVFALLCMALPNLNEAQKAFFDELDEAFMSAECNVGDEEIEILSEFLHGCDVLIIDDALVNSHSDKANIQSFLALLQDEYGFKILTLNGEEFRPQKSNLIEPQELDSYDGAVVFKHNQNSEFIGGAYFCAVAKISDGDECEISTPNFTLRRKFRLDQSIKGTVAHLGFGGQSFDGYNFELAKVSKA